MIAAALGVLPLLSVAQKGVSALLSQGSAELKAASQALSGGQDLPGAAELAQSQTPQGSKNGGLLSGGMMSALLSLQDIA
ncbi:MAG: hypothetical protein ACREEW_10180 [Caulobacteraceae bacterium]